MGVGYYQSLVQWSAGEYAGANNQENDLALMQTYGAPLLGDDHGDSINQASDVASSSDGSTATLSARGRIGTRSDRDLFRFFAGSGTFSISADPVPDAPNLDLLLTVLDSTGTPVASNNPESTLASVVSGTLAAGEYFLEVSGAGKGDVLGNGYSDYASLGYYQVSGSVADSSGLAPPLAAASAPGYVPGFAPQYVGFDGSGSQDAVQWDWDFGDGSGASGATVNHSYSAPGDYTVTLTVFSEAGLSDSDSLTITVDNRDPLAAFSATPGSGTAPVTVSFDASGSRDEDTLSDPGHGIVDYRWDFGDGGFASGRSVQHEYVSGGPFTATLTVTDSLGATGSTAQQLDIAAPPFSDHAASGEANSAGTVTGSYLATRDNDGVLQTIRERESGGRKNSRYSYLEHRWYFNVPAGDSAMLYVSGFRDSSADGDDMGFSYQLGNGAETALPIALGTESSTQLAALPATGGELTLIVRDTDRSAGNLDLDAVFIDQLYVQVSNGSGGGSELPPAAPSNLTATADTSSVSLSWTDNAGDETGFTIYRAVGDGSQEMLSSVGADETAFTDSGLSPGTRYSYRVVAFNAAGESAPAGTTATTDSLSGISLSGSGSKVKGVQTVNLNWSGADSGELWRDGVSRGTVSGGSFEESLGKGGGSYNYMLCSDGICSNEVLIVF
jgi:PKD repeat protein